MIIYSNSCSFGAPNQPHDIYPELVSAHFNATLVNRGIAGSCNRRIIRTSTRDLLELKNKSKNEEILCLIGLTFISRTELWQPNIAATDNDGHFHSIQIDFRKHDYTAGLINTFIKDVHLSAPVEIKDYYKQWLLHLSKEAVVTDLITDLILFKNFCQQQNIKILIWNNAQLWPSQPEVDVDDIFLKTFSNLTINDKNILNLWKFCFLDYALAMGHSPRDVHILGSSGHPGGPAHQDFARYLINYLTELQ